MENNNEKVTMQEFLQKQIEALKEQKEKIKKPCDKALEKLAAINLQKAEAESLKIELNEASKVKTDLLQIGICPRCSGDLNGKESVKAGGFNHEKPYNKLPDKRIVTLSCPDCDFVFEFEKPQQQQQRR